MLQPEATNAPCLSPNPRTTKLRQYAPPAPRNARGDPNGSTRACKKTPQENVLPRRTSSPASLRTLRSTGNQSGSELDDWLQAEEEIRRAEEEIRSR
ncbi:MAG: hypothetical protein DMG57_10905 [Acidobacteria bacterium]|nr:MAG: hypothetical protein DMG57_10905 [Acidobacteriota bacterium]